MSDNVHRIDVTYIDLTRSNPRGLTFSFLSHCKFLTVQVPGRVYAV